MHKDMEEKCYIPKYEELQNKIAHLESLLQLNGIKIPNEFSSEDSTQDIVSQNSVFDLKEEILYFISDAVVVTNNRGNLVYVNQKYYDLHGFDTTSDFNSTYCKYIHPDDLQNWHEFTSATHQNGDSLEYRFQHNFGYWILLRKTIFQSKKSDSGYSICIIQNLTNQKKTEHALQDSESFIEKVINTSPSITYIYDFEERRNIYINNGIYKLLGFNIEELKGGEDEVFTRLMHPSDLPRWEKHQNRIKQSADNEVTEVEYMFKHKNGGWRWLRCWESVFLRNKNGGVKQVSGFLLDVTNQKRTEQALTQNERSLKRQNEELLEAKRKAENADRLKSAFLANMSHEIRTPMNGIVGFSQLLAKESLNIDKRRHYTDVIIKSGQQLLAIIGDIMDISKIETGQVNIQPESVSIHALFSDLKALYRPLFVEKRLQLQFSVAFDEDESLVLIDKTKLTQIITNLINNALKFTAEGGIEVGCCINEGMLQFWVKDTGVGIPTETLPSVFDRFYQVEQNTRYFNGGTGLGLSICKAFVELMNGEIWVESTVGYGTCFWFNLPWIPLSIPQMRIETNSPNENIQATVLVAEDEDINYQYLEEIYQSSSITLLRAKSGRECIEIHKQNPDIDIVLMDIRMPIMNGYDATVEIRKINKELPIVAVTAYALSEDRQRFLPAGFNDYIAKPYTKEQIDDVFAKYCKSKQSLSSQNTLSA